MQYLRITGLIFNAIALIILGVLFIVSLNKVVLGLNPIVIICITALLINLRKFYNQSTFNTHDALLINLLSAVLNFCLIASIIGVFLTGQTASNSAFLHVEYKVLLIVYGLAGCFGLVACFGFQYPKTKKLSHPNSVQQNIASTPPAFDPSLYPATYHSSIGAGVGLVLAVTVSFLLAVFARAHLSVNSPFGLKLFILAILGMVVLTALDSACARITLYVNRIESKTWFGKRVMLRSDIEGMRLWGQFDIPSLIYKDNADYPFTLPKGIKEDIAWRAWMASVPDLDALDKRKSVS